MAERSQQLEELITTFLEQDHSARASFLLEACGRDESLRSEVEAFLASREASKAVSETQTLAMTSPAAPAGMATGRCIGAYRILHPIGHGGMGDVFLAVRADQLYQKFFAIKLLRTGLGSENALRRFRNERQTLAVLDHPNIVKLIDGGTTDEGLPYFVMDYVQGSRIDEYCESHKLTITERLQLFRTVCGAVSYAHQNLIVHRDIKPSNIMVTEQGVPKLLDFGIAKLLKPEFASEIALTSPEQRPMTPEYASPEQLLGQPITTSSDVYSLGVLLYRLLTGHPPYQLKANNRLELDKAICGQEPEKPSVIVTRIEEAAPARESPVTLTPQVVSATREGGPEKLRRRLSGELDMITLMALRKEPQRRYNSVEQFSQDILRHLEGRRVIACKDTFQYRSAKFIRSHKTGVGAAALIFIALVAGLIGTLSQARVADAQRAKAVRRFNEVRALAHFVLFDFDQAIRSGPTPARKLLIGNALEYLNRLAGEAAGDPELQKDLIEGYFKVGDVQGNLYGPNVGDLKSAKASYESALRLAEKLHNSTFRNAQSARYLAMANEKLGDLLISTRDSATALDQYRKALSGFEALSKKEPGKLELKLDVMNIRQKVSFAQFKLGQLERSLEGYHACLQAGEDLVSHNFRTTEVLRSIANSTLRTGEILAMSNRKAEGLEKTRTALDIYRRLSAENPDHAQALHDLWSAYTVLGEVLAENGKNAEAVVEMEEGLGIMEALGREDPHNMRSQRDISLALGYLAETYLTAGQREKAHVLSRRALHILKTVSDTPEALPDDHRHYAWYLVTTPFTDLKNPAEAKRHAELAVNMTSGTEFAAWDTLAMSYEAIGQIEKAIESEQKALALLPPVSGGKPTHDRKEMEANLARFKSKLNGSPAFARKP